MNKPVKIFSLFVFTALFCFASVYAEDLPEKESLAAPSIEAPKSSAPDSSLSKGLPTAADPTLVTGTQNPSRVSRPPGYPDQMDPIRVGGDDRVFTGWRMGCPMGYRCEYNAWKREAKCLWSSEYYEARRGGDCFGMPLR